jgi:uncharacterized membrane protein YfcA
MLRGRRGDDGDDSAAMPRLAFLVPTALSVGLLTGLVGIGGGFLVVPALVILARMPMRQAIGTSLLVIAMNSASGFVGYLGTVQIDWAFLAGFTAMSVVGLLIGINLSRAVPQATLKKGFAVFLIAIGAFVLYRNRAVFVSDTSTSTSSRPAPPAAR